MMLRLLPEVIDGTHARFPQIRMGQFCNLELTADRPLLIHTDGEIFRLRQPYAQTIGDPAWCARSNYNETHMPDLIKSLQGRDLGHLKIVAQLWQMELNARMCRLACSTWRELLSGSAFWSRLSPSEARAALQDLAGSGPGCPGHASPAATGWCERWGLDAGTERPYLEPVSPLKYCGIARSDALFGQPAVEEFAYIQDLVTYGRRTWGKMSWQKICARTIPGTGLSSGTNSPAT
jgi:hypothetical protein